MHFAAGTRLGSYTVVAPLGAGACDRDSMVVRLGHAPAIGAIAHRLCRLVWKLLHDRVAYEERGPAVTQARAQRRAAKMIRELRSLGYRIEPVSSPASDLAWSREFFDPGSTS